MATIHNTFIRKLNDKAVIITVTDWSDFAELEQFSEEENPDFLVSATTTKSMYSNMQPSMQINTYEAIDLTEGTKGMGLAEIITEGCDNAGKNGELEKFIGGIWSYKKAGLTYSEQASKPHIN